MAGDDTPHPPVFFAQRVRKAHENKRVEFFGKSKRVRKDVKRKNLNKKSEFPWPTRAMLSKLGRMPSHPCRLCKSGKQRTLQNAELGSVWRMEGALFVLLLLPGSGREKIQA